MPRCQPKTRPRRRSEALFALLVATGAAALAQPAPLAAQDLGLRGEVTDAGVTPDQDGIVTGAVAGTQDTVSVPTSAPAYLPISPGAVQDQPDAAPGSGDPGAAQGASPDTQADGFADIAPAGTRAAAPSAQPPDNAATAAAGRKPATATAVSEDDGDAPSAGDANPRARTVDYEDRQPLDPRAARGVDRRLRHHRDIASRHRVARDPLPAAVTAAVPPAERGRGRQAAREPRVAQHPDPPRHRLRPGAMRQLVDETFGEETGIAVRAAAQMPAGQPDLRRMMFDEASAGAVRRHRPRDRIAVHGFASNGRHEVNYERVKDFDEPFEGPQQERLTSLTSRLSTRMGAALRHATAALVNEHADHKVILVLTDGEPSDIDVMEEDYLVEDAREAVASAAANKVRTFCLTLDKRADRYVRRIFGIRNYLITERAATFTNKTSNTLMRLLAP